MLAQILWHVGSVSEEATEGFAIGIDDGVIHIHLIQSHRAVKAVDYCLYRITHIVEITTQSAVGGELLGVGTLSEGIAIGGGVGVDYILDSPIADDRIRVAVKT